MGLLNRKLSLRWIVLSIWGTAVLVWLVSRGPPNLGPVAPLSPAKMQALAGQLTALEQAEDEIAKRFWGPELSAQKCGAVIELLWNSLNAATNKLEALRAFSFPFIRLPQFDESKAYPHGIRRFESTGKSTEVTREAWLSLLNQATTAGWDLAQVEFRHLQFETNSAGEPLLSRYYVRGDLVNPGLPERATVEGAINVRWGKEADGVPTLAGIDASRLRLLRRAGNLPFRELLRQEVRPAEKSHFIDPVILYDLDGDGYPEIILAARNLALKRQSDRSYAQAPLCREFTGPIFTAVIADFDGDGYADFLCAEFEGLRLFTGSATGRFEGPGRLVWAAHPRLQYAQVLTCGDIDHDGDLDAWLGQYKNPYERGQMPTPYYDANDGNPSYFLVNDGHGNFQDATESAGLGAKRWRRTYSGSFVDLNGDGHLDLLVVSDFAGVDVYGNDGSGHFTDRTERWLPERHTFGMAHTLADFNQDGRLDFLVTGMHCPTAQRLDHLGLTRPGRPDYETMRPRMTTGNRLFLGNPAGGFASGALGLSIQYSGWSWGCSAFDWDNDGYPDVYIANGHETRQSVQDYEAEFWLHDIYVANSRDDLVKSAYFGAKIGRTRGHGYSYGGYEKNRLFLNQNGQSFLEAGYLLGVALEEDCRNVVSGDLDGDGRVDLVVTTFEAWPRVQQTLRVFRNTLEPEGNWIGFRLREEGHGVSPIGARVSLRQGKEITAQQIVTGDSHRSQRATTVHFGLGARTRVDAVEIRWQNGRSATIERPAINQYYTVSPSR